MNHAGSRFLIFVSRQAGMAGKGGAVEPVWLDPTIPLTSIPVAVAADLALPAERSPGADWQA